MKLFLLNNKLLKMIRFYLVFIKSLIISNGLWYLEPVDGTAIDERREFSESVAERFSNRTHGKHNMQLISATLNEHIEERHW